VSSGGFWPGDRPASPEPVGGEEAPPPSAAGRPFSANDVGDDPGSAAAPEPAADTAEDAGDEDTGDQVAVAPPGVVPPVEPAPEHVRPEHESEPPAGPEPPAAPAAQSEPRLTDHAPGELRVPDDVVRLEGSPSGPGRSVGIVVSRFNGDVTNLLLESALAELDNADIPREHVTVVPVPGAFELPLAAMGLAKTRRYACIVALGCVIRGETAHFDYVAGEAASGLQLAGLETGVPVAFGVLTVDTLEQAMARTGRGADAARSALEMADLFTQLRQQRA
jgi:6,7-dimethyl-8-ribityllumazine synthase